MRLHLLSLAVALSACGPPQAAPLGERVADFLLEDLNPSSPRFGDALSPRDYLGEVSGWYFIHST